ncbi:hypothetical protein EDC96DRAFT_154608 [Choanephora cucurbitarum]|nr:hypothetical protein EDC96DRAFT_154608 [Choanephora cucurbitarum]
MLSLHHIIIIQSMSLESPHSSHLRNIQYNNKISVILTLVLWLEALYETCVCMRHSICLLSLISFMHVHHGISTTSATNYWIYMTQSHVNAFCNSSDVNFLICFIAHQLRPQFIVPNGLFVCDGPNVCDSFIVVLCMMYSLVLSSEVVVINPQH